VSWGSPALRLLARRKFVGFWRRQARRMRTLKGAVLALLGLGVFALWFGSLLFSRARGETVQDPRLLELMVGAGLFALTVLSVSNALTFRGLYIHPSEIETLFSAPVSRADLVRFRLASQLGRTLVGAAFFAALLSMRAPHAWYGALGGLMAMLTLPVFAQGVSILAGSAENRWAARLARLPLRRVALVLFLVALYFLLWFPDWNGPALAGSRTQVLAAVAEHPVVVALGLPFQPWANAIAARDAATFLTWFAVDALLLVALIEGVARLPVDFRELSLETSADVARRLSRARRGMPAAGAAGARTRGWSVPWILGRGPAGAVAWRKLVGVVRKAGTSILIGALITAAIAFFSLLPRRGEPWLSQVIVAGAGTFYLSLGLRNDFREDFEAMSQVKAWPVRPWKLFLATLVPQTLIVSAMIEAGLVGVTLYRGNYDPLFLLLGAAVPLVVLMWVSIDNAVFLYAPTRGTPGQDTALQNAGRSILLMLLRVGVLAVVAFGAALPALLASGVFGWEARAALALGGSVGLVVLALEIAALVALGALVLRRFDVASDRG
jgi:hypothetical protein